MKSMFLMLLIPSLVLLGPGGESAEIVPGQEDLAGTGSKGHVFDITMESYRHFPEITREMLAAGDGNAPMASEFGQAYDEINMIAFGYEDHIAEERAGFLKGLDITLFGVHDDSLTAGIHPSQGDRLAEIRDRFGAVCPDVEIGVDVGEFSYLWAATACADTAARSFTVSTAMPNGGGAPASNQIWAPERAAKPPHCRYSCGPRGFVMGCT